MSTVSQPALFFCVLFTCFTGLTGSFYAESAPKDGGKIMEKLIKATSNVVNQSSRKIRIEMAKKEILKKLGMKSRPPQMHDLRANVPKPVFDGEISSLFSESTDPAKTTQIVVPAEEGNRPGCRNDKGCFSFHVTHKVFKNQFAEFATLQFYKERSSSYRSTHKIRLELIGRKVKLIARKRIPITTDWISFTIVNEVERWSRGSGKYEEFHLLQITCEDCTSRDEFNVSTRPRYRPFLLIRTREREIEHKRKRRSYSVECIPGYDKCCRQSLFVSFKEIGWHDWIIEPAGFDVNFCEGRCSGSTAMVSKSHGFVKKELMRYKKNKFLSVCCVPTKFGRLTLLHFDEDGFIFKTTLENMVVRECGCM